MAVVSGASRRWKPTLLQSQSHSSKKIHQTRLSISQSTPQNFTSVKCQYSSSSYHNHHREEGTLPPFWERLLLAWQVLFPPPKPRATSSSIAKQRLKMILISDRCAVSDEAKRKIVSNIVAALSNFVEIESEDNVQLSVSTDLDLGTIYSVSVPVRRVKPEYQRVPLPQLKSQQEL